MLELHILVVIIYIAFLTGISEQAVLTCNGGDTPSFREDDVRVVDGYLRSSRDDVIFLGSDQNLTVFSFGANYITTELGVCYSTSDFGCYKGGTNGADCDNFIRGVTALETCNPSCRVLVCGSNALLPRCTVCNFDGSALSCNFIENNPSQDLPYIPNIDSNYTSCTADNINGQGVFQVRKNHNATFLLNNDKIYYGLVKDDSDTNSIIGLASINQTSGEISDEVTTRTDSQKMVATEAHFVGGPFIRDYFVYFLFREPAQEFASLTEGQGFEINTYYSRIARICKDDVGTDVSSARILTSFLKQRLVCSQEEDTIWSVEYNEIQDFVFSDADNMIHAIFTNEQNDAPMSALCVFNLTAIDETFNTGSFFGADGGTTNDLWRENTGSTISPRPGLDCSNPNTGNTNFERDYNLMNDPAKQTSTVPIFMEGDRFSSLEMPEGEDIYIIASERGCLYQVDVDTAETDLGDPCQDPIVSSPIKDLELAPDDSYLVTTLDEVYVLNRCNKSDETGGEAGARILSPAAGSYDMRPNSFFESIANIEITGPPNIYFTASGMQIDDYLLLKNEGLDTTDTLFLIRILILNESVTVEFPDAPNLNYTLKPYKKYTTYELDQRCDEWDAAYDTYAYLNRTDRCGSATATVSGTFNSSIVLKNNQVLNCDNCAYNDCTDTCPP